MAKTILIIEDDANLRSILSEKFTSEGFTVIQAENGKIGLDKFSTSPDINVILLDLYMPIMDGHAFLDELRKLPKGQQMPVVVLSNMVDRDYVVGAFDKSITDYLLKSNTELDVIVERVKKAAKV
jgi:CheY-like chemotaxis protein